MALAADRTGLIAGCPFCGREHRQRVAEYSQRGVRFRVVCQCTGQGPQRDDWDEAVEAWNAARVPSSITGDGV